MAKDGGSMSPGELVAEAIAGIKANAGSGGLTPLQKQSVRKLEAALVLMNARPKKIEA